MTAPDVSTRVFSRIAAARLKPRPRWMFRALHACSWIAYGLSVLLASVCGALCLLLLGETPWEVAALVARDPRIGVLLALLPLFWFCSLVFALILAFVNARHTRRGYRWHAWTIVVGSLSVSVVLGVFIHVSGIGDRIERSVERKVPPYSTASDERHALWAHPEQGVLAGTVEEMQSGAFLLRDPLGSVWTVDVRMARISRGIMLGTGVSLSLKGTIAGDELFRAVDVRFWRGHLPPARKAGGSSSLQNK